jgi:hypothetical protein
MASPFSTQVWSHLEGDACSINAFIAIDGSSNVIGIAPTTPGLFSATTAYTRAKGMSIAIGQAGSIVTQPHTATGTYLFTLDEPWVALLNPGVSLVDQGAVAALSSFIDANVTTATSGLGAYPGQNMTLAPRAVRVRFRNNAGALTDPVASTGFWLTLTMKRTSF